MDAAAVIRSAPAVLELGDDPAATSRLDETLVAVQGGSPTPAVTSFEGGNLVVAPVGSAPGPGEGARIGPVYRQRSGGLAVPTGRVLVRFRPDDSPRAHAEALDEAGFKLDEILGYAPHAAWVRPHSEEAVAALDGLGKLRSLPGVEHVEPQVLTAAAPRRL
jgi:hypothetical protein